MRRPLANCGALALVAGLSLGVSVPAAKYTALDERGDPLRTTFNADIGKVRVMMLVAPT